MRKIATVVIAILFTLSMNAQISTPQPSPSSKLEQTVGLGTVTVEYSRPSLKGRTIFGNENEKSIEKYGKPWRTGANSATKVTFSEDVKVNGKELKEGAYALLTVPGMKEWTVMFFPYETSNWGSYTEKDPALETKVMASKSERMVENFTIDINNMTSSSATIDLMWGDFMVSIPMTVDTDSKVSNSIASVMSGPSQNDYYQAASYYHDQGKDLNQALTWIQKANEKDAKYWMARREALILGDMKNYDQAIAKAKMSKELAEKAGNEAYVRMNDESITTWSKMAGGKEKVQVMEKKKSAPKQ